MKKIYNLFSWKLLLIDSYFRFFRKRKLMTQYLKDLFLNLFNIDVKSFKGKIYVLGDSHSYFWSGNEDIYNKHFLNDIGTSRNLISFIDIFYLGPALAFNASKKDSTTKVLEKTLFLTQNNIIPAKSTIMLSLGEIDCRVHVIKQAEKQNKQVNEVIDEILNNYFKYIEILKSKKYKIICFAPIASQKDECIINPELPRYGSEEQRNKLTKIFHEKLKEKCTQNNVYYLSFIDKLMDSDYQTNKDYLNTDNLHLSQKALNIAIEELYNQNFISYNEKTKQLYVNHRL